MNELNSFNWSGYSRWQEPPDIHEVCECFMCHENEEHMWYREDWAKLCVHCASDLVDGAELALDER